MRRDLRNNFSYSAFKFLRHKIGGALINRRKMLAKKVHPISKSKATEVRNNCLDRTKQAFWPKNKSSFQADEAYEEETTLKIWRKKSLERLAHNKIRFCRFLPIVQVGERTQEWKKEFRLVVFLPSNRGKVLGYSVEMCASFCHLRFYVKSIFGNY